MRYFAALEVALTAAEGWNVEQSGCSPLGIRCLVIRSIVSAVNPLLLHSSIVPAEDFFFPLSSLFFCPPAQNAYLRSFRSPPVERSLSAALTSADVCQIPLTVKREQSGCEPDNIPDVQTQT